MEKRISDLLNSSLDPDINIGVQEVASTNRIKELTMSKVAATKPARARNAMRTALIPALTIIMLFFALTGVAYASDAFGLRTMLKEFFAGSETELSKDVLEEIIRVGNGVAPPAATSNGTTVTPMSAIAGEDFYYLTIQIDAPEGTDLVRPRDMYQVHLQNGQVSEEELLSYYQIWGGSGEHPELLYADGSPVQLNAGISVSFQDDDPSDNSIVVVIELDASANPLPHGVAFNDGVAKFLTIHGLWFQSPDKIYTKILDGEWTFDIGTYFTVVAE